MKNKVTTVAPANIAFIKYWGRNNHELFIPSNSSISMTLSNCLTTSTIEIDDSLKEDLIEIKFENQDYKKLDLSSIKAADLIKQINRIRKLSGINSHIRIKSENNFPADAGLASSASSFAAITAGLLIVFGLNNKFDDKIELSREIRLSGSGSAARSAMGGFVELLSGNDHNSTHAIQIAKANHWELLDIIAVVDTEKKKISSSEGHNLANTSPYFATRLIEMQDRIMQTRESILAKDFKTLGECIEDDMLSMHLIMMTQKPSLFYWSPGSVAIMRAIRELREEKGILAYCTLDAGPNVHIICEDKNRDYIKSFINEIPYVKKIIVNEPAEGVIEIDKHLF
jgi:diphosphomevalonate decarboxylase